MKFEKGSIKHLIYSVISTVIFGFIFFPLFDFIACKLISKTEFEYSVRGHIIEPLVICSVIAVVFWIVERNKAKK